MRNPLIAETMYKPRDIERWGSGIKRIHDECTASGARVEFKRLKTGFVVIFFRPKWEEGEGLEAGGQKKGPEKVTEKVTENQRMILETMIANPHVAAPELSRVVRISERRIKENLRKLKSRGLLKRVGLDKGGHWEVVGN